jgi:predicted secreted hydrolase
MPLPAVRAFLFSMAHTISRSSIRALITALLVLATSPVWAQRPDTDYRLAEPGWIFEFPRDHGSHPEFQTEWWYYTGHLRTESGKRYGFEVTFFRVGAGVPDTDLGTNWDLSDLHLAHFALTAISDGSFRYYEKLNRSSRFVADARKGNLAVFNENWSATASPDGSFRLRAAEGGDSIDLRLLPLKPPAIHGRDGISIKAEGEGYASHYYSLTRLEATGTVGAEGITEPCSGQAWMDHEFGSATLREYQQGWDWFSIQLDNRNEIMLYVIRRSDGTPDVTSSGSIVLADGSVIHLERDDFAIRARDSWKSPRSGAVYPLDWEIEIKPFDVSLRVREVMENQELVTDSSTQITYWEGAVDVTGRFGGTVVSGEGYVEMTGYDKPFRD